MQGSELLIEKLDAFIRKYYRNMLLRGSLIFLGLFLLSFLLVASLEYFGRYTSMVRAVLFYTLLTLSVVLLARYILYPLAALYRLRRQISYEQAAEIIGRHFSHVSDKLTNTLQLLQQTDKDNSLLMAAIAQKTADLAPVPFVAAVDYKSNYRYLKLALIPILLLLLSLFIFPGLVSDGAMRVISYEQTFKIPAPFTFTVENDKLEAAQFEDFELNVKVSGSELPQEINIHIGKEVYRLQKQDATHFTHTFRNLQQSVPFYLEALGFEDNQRVLKVNSRPVMLGYQVKMQYPSYLGKAAETVSNPGDLQIPAGTTLQWNFTGKETGEIALAFSKWKALAASQDRIHYSYTRKFFLSDAYSISLKNDNGTPGDSLFFHIDVVPDAFPALQVEEQKDSVSGKFVYFGGSAQDDHGLTRLAFHYKFLAADEKAKTDKGLQTQWLTIAPGKQLDFTHVFNLYELGFASGDELEYYFEVWDNDGVHGSKSVRSKPFTVKAPGKNELREQSAGESKELQKKMEEALKESKDLQRDMKDMERKMKTEQNLTWEEKRKLENMQQRQKELMQKMEELKKDYKLKNEKEQSFKEEDERIVQKQQELQKMYEELMTEEMKKLMKEMEQMMKMQNKELIQKELEKMDMSNKDVEKELDRMLEMYKQLELEKRREAAMKDLKDLAKKQEELSKQTEEKSLSKEELGKKQEELNKEFNDLQKELRNQEQRNKEMENPKDMGDTKELEKQIEDKMQKSSEELNKGNNKKSSQNQKEAADEMQQMAEKMQEKMDQEEEEQAEIDEQALREILENLIQLSKDQEQVMVQMKTITGYNPQFVQMAQEQKNLKDNARMIEDSLLALSKRVPEIKSYVNKEVGKMNNHLEKANNSFSTRSAGEIRMHQQYAMTSMNNLGVMLSDALQQMQQQQQQKKQGKSGSKGKPQKKPGQGKPSMSQLKKMQEEMNKQMKDGMNKNGSGEKGKMSSEQYARMAAQQMAIRQQMQKMLSQMDALEKEKLGGGKQLGDLQKMMEETEKDLVNKRLTQETLMRQQEILTRLLEHEKAEKKQDEEMKREANRGKETPRPSPQYLERFKPKKGDAREIEDKIPLEMQPYYRERTRQYLEGR